MDWALLPPEINSARIIAGPGAGPLLASATAWTQLASELYAAAAAWQSTTATLLAAWRGPSATAMGAAAALHAAWYTQAAAHAETTSGAATMAASAYEAAVASTVPLPLVIANRAHLMTLVATNILGQNTAAIMATEAIYMQMWAQDAAAMGTYQASSAAATSSLTSLPAPMPAGNSGAAAVAVPQAVSSNTAGVLSGLLTNLIGSGGFLNNSTTSGQLIQAFISSSNWIGWPIELLSLMSLFGIDSGVGTLDSELAATGPPAAAMQDVAAAPLSQIPVRSSETEAPSARIGAARPLGAVGMSIPPSWADAAQQPTMSKEPLVVRPLESRPGGGLGAAPIPTAIAATQKDKGNRRQSVEDSALLKTAKFTPKPIA